MNYTSEQLEIIEERIDRLKECYNVKMIEDSSRYEDVKDYDVIFLLEATQSYDYLGAYLANKSNKIYLKENHTLLIERFNGLAVRIGDLLKFDDDFIESIEALTEYPIIDDDTYNEVCEAAKRESFNDSLRDDFILALDERLNCTFFESYQNDAVEEKIQDDLYYLFCHLVSECCLDWSEDSYGGYFVDVRALVNAVKPQEIMDYCYFNNLSFTLTQWQYWSYDLWSDGYAGYLVNNRFEEHIQCLWATVEPLDKYDVIRKAHISDDALMLDLDLPEDCTIEGDNTVLYFLTEDHVPICEIECTSHDSLNELSLISN